MRSGQSFPASGAAQIAPSLKDFTNTFVLSSTSNSEQVLFELPKALVVDPFRQRRTHRKSRMGCENCRRRRVKCNEQTPCASCTRRREQCQRPVRCNSTNSITPMPAQIPLSSSASTGSVVNLLHLKLFHHFQKYTAQTLLFAPEVWGHALQLCFQFDYLMNTVLCVAARHLTFLLPEEAEYPKAAGRHLCRALSRFRHELSTSFTSIHIDAFVATSLLLQYELWSSTDFLSPEENGTTSFDPPRDRLFAFSSSLKQVFLKSVPLISDQPSVIMPHLQLQHNPTDTLIEHAQISNGTLSQYQDFFSYHRPLNLEILKAPLPHMRGMDLTFPNTLQDHVHEVQTVLDPIEDGYAPVISRLCLIQSFLPETRPPDSISTESPLMPELARYILSFPVTCHGPFASMVQKSDIHALLLLYHFYRAVRILLPKSECWWAYKRAIVSEKVLKEWLTIESAKQAGAYILK